ncbi:lytic murein transglycosylase [Rhodosalinus halophilus]|uniref:Lytic murein transglycosylase n=1 Tax=Rhodosalinus halophilus TaxID=2259333 RepID=A0A365U8L6_9RHOB|nr:lytic murein transglycosylase [Rhodosalinus halophilus]RBI84814.1 lytic murein transglycosylase [Rhodosalinus halophilus]
MREFTLICLLAAATPAAPSTPCGGSFGGFVADLREEALARGHAPSVVESFFRGVRQDQSVLRADRRQGVFQLPFVDFARRLISENRIRNGRRNAERWDSVFDRIEAEYGVSRGILLSFWAFETDYGAVQGDYNTRDALVTLAHDCRRPEIFRPQVFAAIELHARGDLDPQTTTGAWAGEIGMVQMLPEDILTNGVDGDGDGHVSLKTSPPDALMSGAKMLVDLGWRANEPWMTEIDVPADFDWSLSGLPVEKPVADWAALGVTARSGDLGPAELSASVVAPQGHLGPTFLVYPNFRVLFEWNQSFVYVMTAAYFGTRLEGAPVFDAGDPEPGLSDAQMKRLQQRLADMGHDVGGIDGILGAKTRAAVRAVQEEFGLPPDGWPTPGLLNRL